ncbi:hypothetical protein AAZX31_07G181500 [Glycine max]|uniref:EngB-type G domain-containing protein n=1 Tax=Glycine max TaxID=3847 RepID=A0A0R0J5G8_SOYBN
MTALVRRAVMKLSLQFQTPSSLSLSPSSLSISKTPTPPSLFSFRHPLSHSTHASKTTTSPPPSFEFQLFIPPGIEPDEVNDSTVLPGSNIAVGPYAGDSHIKDVQFVKSSARARDCPKDNRPEFAVLGRSNVGKSSLINSLVRKKEIALTSKKPGKTQLINHFLVNKSCFAKAPEAAKTDWSSFTKGYFLNKSTLVAVLLLIDASVPPQKIDLDCANWLGRNNIPITFVFTKCDKMKVAKGKRPDENIRDFQELIRQNYKQHPPWIMTSSATGMGRDELLLHMSQLRNYWDQ